MDAVEEVKSRLGIEDVISEYVQLKRAGRNWKGLSPFGNEKTPSFIVSPEKQIWHDFSSGRGGDMFGFVMEMEGVDFRGALELLARKAGVDLEQYRRPGQSRGPNKERLYELLEAAARFYQVQFKGNRTALEYVFKKRLFSKETALEWRLGYSPNNGSALIEHLKRKKFTEAEMQQAGVTAKNYRGGVQDMFRGRLMIPLQDPQGRVIGFTARLLEDDPEAPKYINTPATVLYDKSRHIYGLHLAKEAIRKVKYVVLAEGNLDVIASHQAGVRQVVATAGTALTEPHLKALSRFTGDIRLCFDADKAGMNATERAIPIASKVRVSLSIISIPSGKDPDELIKQDPEIWKAIIEQPQYALDWLIERYQGLLDISSAQGKREFSDVLLPVVRALDDAVERDHYLVEIAGMIGVSREALEQKTARIQAEPGARAGIKKKKTPNTPVDRKLVENIKAQDHLLAMALLQPKVREYLVLLTPEMFLREEARALLAFLQRDVIPATEPESRRETGSEAQIQPGSRIKSGMTRAEERAVSKELSPIGDYVKIVVLQYEELYQGLELTELRYEAARLQARVVEQFVKNQKQILAARLTDADEAETESLLTEVKQLDNLLNQVKGR